MYEERCILQQQERCLLATPKAWQRWCAGLSKYHLSRPRIDFFSFARTKPRINVGVGDPYVLGGKIAGVALSACSNKCAPQPTLSHPIPPHPRCLFDVWIIDGIRPCFVLPVSFTQLYYNALVPISTTSHRGRSMKYGVISMNHLQEDLGDWTWLYTAGRYVLNYLFLAVYRAQADNSSHVRHPYCPAANHRL